MKVSRLPIDPGPAAWADLLPPAAAAQRLEGRHTADWLVIGGGFAGFADESSDQSNATRYLL